MILEGSYKKAVQFALFTLTFLSLSFFSFANPSLIAANDTCTAVCVSTPSCMKVQSVSAPGSCANPAELCCKSIGKVSKIPEQDAFEKGLEVSIKKQLPSLEKTVYSNLNGIQSMTIANLLGSDLIDKATSDYYGIPVQKSGLVPGLTSAIGYMYSSPPATTEQYVAYLMDSAGIGLASPAYAQAVGGLGFSSLLPILDTWIKLRNLAYLFFVIVFVVIGFMIMFRQKIGSQTVVTVQQAIPQVIISLLAVTFSFAIAGLLIDAMYISMFLLVAVFGSPTSSDSISILNRDFGPANYLSGSIFEIGIFLFNNGTSNTFEVVSELVQNVLQIDDRFIEGIIGGIGGLTAVFIFAVIIAMAIFKLFLELLQTYVSILISIIAAPIALMLGAIPGKSFFSAWVWGLIGNLAAFPTVLFVLLIYDNLTVAFAGGAGEATGFIPPYLTGGGVNGDAIQGLIAIGIIVILPTIVKQAKAAFGAKAGFFDQFTGVFTDAFKSGWKGGEIAPGLGFTNTANYGVSGKNAFIQMTRKPTIAAASILPGLYGAVEGRRLYNQGNRDENMAKGFIRRSSTVANSVGGFLGDKMFTNKKKEKK
jgi:hypothetical protein